MMLIEDIKLEAKVSENSLIGLKEGLRKMKGKESLSSTIIVRNQDTPLINAIESMVFLQVSSSPKEEEWQQMSTIMKKSLQMEIEFQIKLISPLLTAAWSLDYLKNSLAN